MPEGLTYQDTGCDLAPSCLNCPFPSCRYDFPGTKRAGKYALILSAAREVVATPGGYKLISLRFSIGKRAAFRWLALARSLDSPLSTIGRDP